VSVKSKRVRFILQKDEVGIGIWRSWEDEHSDGVWLVRAVPYQTGGSTLIVKRSL